VIDDQKTAQRREEILVAAEKVFDANGYASTTMEAVAVEAGISKGSIYNYFQSKHDLFRQVFSRAVTTGQEQAARLIDEPLTATEKLRRILHQWFGQLSYYRRIGRLVLEFWATAARESQGGELAGWFQQMYILERSIIARIVAQGVEAGEFRDDFDPSVAAALILATIDGLSVQVVLDIRTEVDEGFVASLERAIIAALTHKPPQPKRAEVLK